MAQPAKGNSAFADSNDIPILGDQGALVTAAAAATHAAPAVTVETLTENSSGTPDTTIADVVNAVTARGGDGMDGTQEGEVNVLFGLCDDNFADLADQQSKIRVDNAATLVELDDLADDVALLRTAVNDLIDRMEAHGFIADN